MIRLYDKLLQNIQKFNVKYTNFTVLYIDIIKTIVLTLKYDYFIMKMSCKM